MARSRSRNAAAAVLLVALALGVGSSAVGAPEGDALASRSVLTVVDGTVLTSHDHGDFTRAHESDVLLAGDTVRTGPGSAAEITYFDGSSARIEANAEIVVVSLRTSDRGAAHTLVRAWQVINGLFSGGSRYEVRTPSATASVRG